MTGNDAHLTMPPSAGEGVCPICRSWRGDQFALCWNCQGAADRLGRVAPVLPISLYSKPSVFREWVTRYKGSRGAAIPEFGESLQQVVGTFLAAYGPAIQEDFGPIDYLTPVPSQGSVKSAVVQLFEAAEEHIGPIRSTLYFKPGVPARAAVYGADWFSVTREVDGDRVAIIDDVYTSGARAQSAAATLQEAGAQVKLILVVGRRINPTFSSEALRLWRRQVALDYDFSAAPYWR